MGSGKGLLAMLSVMYIRMPAVKPNCPCNAIVTELDIEKYLIPRLPSRYCYNIFLGQST